MSARSPSNAIYYQADKQSIGHWLIPHPDMGEDGYYLRLRLVAQKCWLRFFSDVSGATFLKANHDDHFRPGSLSALLLAAGSILIALSKSWAYLLTAAILLP